MAFVFKPIEPSHITVTPFYANKLWSVGNTLITDLTDPNGAYVDADISMSIYYGRYHTSSWMTSASEETTSHGEYSRLIWDSVYNMFYRDFQHKPFEKFKQGNVGVETRNITETIQVFSIPQKIIGSGIVPGTFKLEANSYTFVDDGNGNIIGAALEQGNNLYNSNIENFHYCSYLFTDAFINNWIVQPGESINSSTPTNTFYTYNHGNLGSTPNYNYIASLGVAMPVHSPNVLRASVNNVVVGKYAPLSTYFLDFTPYNTDGPSRYVRIPHTSKLNFSENQDFSIVIVANLLGGSNNFILGKYGRERVRVAPWSPSNRQFTNPNVFNNIQFGGEVYEDKILTGQYPYKLEIDSGDNLVFSISDGSRISRVTAPAFTYNWSSITCIKSGSNLQLYVDSALQASAAISCSGAIQNNSDIFIGCSGDEISESDVLTNSPSNLNGQIGSVHFFDRALSQNDIDRLHNDVIVQGSSEYSNNRYGNIIYNQGLIIWTNGRSDALTVPGLFASSSVNFDSMQFRSTKLINTNEVICVSSPNEHTMTTNPTILVKKNGTCNPGIGSDEIGFYNDDGECYSFVTGSDFSPYITGIGLYNEAGELLVIGKLATPIKKALNCDTIFVVRWDS